MACAMIMRRCAWRSLAKTLSSSKALLPIPIQDTAGEFSAGFHHLAKFNPLRGTLPPGKSQKRQPGAYSFHQLRSFSVVNGDLPSISDPEVLKALNSLLARGWLNEVEEVKEEVESVLAKTSDEAGKQVLDSAWRSCQAVEAFSEKLEFLRLELDELSGGKFGGETVGVLPEKLKAALQACLTRYFAYLNAFPPEETWLKKKVETELGGSLLLVKQRCSGLEPDWNKVILLGTSGMSGSYIEKRMA